MEGRGFLWVWVVLISRRFLRRMLAISIVIPQKSGTKCEHVWWHVKLHSGSCKLGPGQYSRKGSPEHLTEFLRPNGSI